MINAVLDFALILLSADFFYCQTCKSFDFKPLLFCASIYTNSTVTVLCDTWWSLLTHWFGQILCTKPTMVFILDSCTTEWRETFVVFPLESKLNHLFRQPLAGLKSSTKPSVPVVILFTHRRALSARCVGACHFLFLLKNVVYLRKVWDYSSQTSAQYLKMPFDTASLFYRCFLRHG